MQTIHIHPWTPPNLNEIWFLKFESISSSTFQTFTEPFLLDSENLLDVWTIPTPPFFSVWSLIAVDQELISWLIGAECEPTKIDAGCVCRVTRWTTFWPPTSARCSPTWTSALGGATVSELLIGRRPPSSSACCAPLVSTAAGGGASPTSCGGWAAALLHIRRDPTWRRRAHPRAATTPAKAPVTTTSTATMMKTSRPVRMTISDITTTLLFSGWFKTELL